MPAGTLDGPAARTVLDQLVVAAPATTAGFDRSCSAGHGCVFGPAWTDDVDVALGHNGCDQRNDVLARDLDQATVVYANPHHPCKVARGTLHDPYTGRTIAFDSAHAAAVQIDHVYPEAAAWRAGASTWTPAQRTNFANDPANLLAVDGPTNLSKGDSTTWLPADHNTWCSYARIVVTVAQRYRLTIDPAQHDTLRTALGTCPAMAGAPG